MKFSKDWFRNHIWKDAVWSKVIAEGLLKLVLPLVFGSLILPFYQSISQDVNFQNALYNFWTLKIPLWSATSVVFLLLFTFFIIYKSKLSQSAQSSLVPEDEQDSFGNMKIIYDGTNPSVYDFDIVHKQQWDKKNKQRFGNLAEGEFEIKEGIIIIKRTNNSGEFQVRLIKYAFDNIVSHYISRDLSKGGRRQFRITCKIKHSGNGNQKVIFVLRNEEELTWLDNRSITVRNEEWQSVNIVLNGNYSKNTIIRIDSVAVNNPPNSVYIKELQVREFI